jgi:formylglycine-generating enzyme required for sulfatase activity
MLVKKRMVVLSLSLFGLLLTALLVISPLSAQDDLPPDQQTVQAGVEALFTATAQAEAYSTFALTVESSFRHTQTAVSQPTLAPTETPLGLNAMTMTDAARLLTSQAATATTALSADGPLLSLSSPLVFVQGGQPFQMGTTRQEIEAAVAQCVNEEGGDCQIEFGEDSIPPHEVTVSSFQIETTEVTYEQYLIFLNALGPNGHLNGCDGQPCISTQQESESSNIVFDGANYTVNNLIQRYPMSGVTWYGADAYCRAIGRRLPTEAEWELAARGYDNLIYPWGNTWDPLLAKTSIPPTEPGAVPVGSYQAGASPWGALDMAGNVAEWVNDWYDPVFYQRPQASGFNPQGPVSPDPENGVQKVIRGGSWDAKPFFARSVHRQSAGIELTGAWLGFRCAADTEVTPTPQGTQAPSPVATLTLQPTAALPRATVTRTPVG